MITKSEVKYIQSLGHKKFRDELKEFVAEGPKIVTELVASTDIPVKAIYATSDWWQEQASLRSHLAPDSAIEVKEQELERLSFLSAPNKVVGIFKQPKLLATASFNDRISLMLDGVQDPGNMGTIIRIADWFGVENIIASGESADIYNPKVVQATMGSIARVKVRYEELSAFIKTYSNIPVYAATLDGQPLSSFGKIKEGLLLIGNESKGISKELSDAAKYKITIPKKGKAESLNAAVAAGIILAQVCFER